jgi:hypothetical protein
MHVVSMSRRSITAVLLALGTCSSLGAQAVGVGYQLARTDQSDTREARGPGLRVRFRGPVELRYDYLANDGERFDYPCGGFVPPGCVQETIHYSSRLHSIVVAGRAALFSRGSFHLAALPELGLVTGTVEKRSVATGITGASGGGGGLSVGVALELSATRVGGSAFGGWVAARVRGIANISPEAQDAYQPLRQLSSIGSLELGVTVALR